MKSILNCDTCTVKECSEEFTRILKRSGKSFRFRQAIDINTVCTGRKGFGDFIYYRDIRGLNFSRCSGAIGRNQDGYTIEVDSQCTVWGIEGVGRLTCAIS